MPYFITSPLSRFPFSRFLRLLPLLALLILALPLFTSCEGQKTIVNQLNEKEANEILVYLSTRGIDGTKVKSAEAGGGGGAGKEVLWDISVPTTQSTEAMYLLNQEGLPRRRSQSLLSIFSTSGLVPSDLQEKIRYRAGLAEQIASTIRKMDGILDAEVQISFPEEDPLNPGQSKGKITASVYVKHSGVLDDPNSHLLTKIKRLVAASVTGLDYDNVTVIAQRSRLGELSGAALPGAGEEEKHFVSIWGIIIATESVTYFRILFFSLILGILLLSLGLIWLMWKFSPLLHKAGWKSLLTLHPISSTPSPLTIGKKGEKTVEPTPSPEEKSDQGLIDKDIDET